MNLIYLLTWNEGKKHTTTTTEKNNKNNRKNNSHHYFTASFLSLFEILSWEISRNPNYEDNCSPLLIYATEKSEGGLTGKVQPFMISFRIITEMSNTTMHLVNIKWCLPEKLRHKAKKSHCNKQFHNLETGLEIGTQRVQVSTAVNKAGVGR